ncbi:hypothetical protein ACGUFB_06320 [Actinotignum schaalii]|uniref:Cardiolipin synthase N-terminal domain-containing protein n=1 Tax=Actinotignum schaalii FB123-CNA-2 TaxID=883067 RepID=S2W7I8_9ACTO|nr:hypothetical protein [Actinotignum schaalii]EPD28582.1 hypothetical protein HMPREF9237_00109 [Actinotignum schaalii FB123-CNA-2]
MEDFLALPAAAQIALGIVALIQLALLITSLVLLSRWPERQLAGVPRPGWAVIILLGSLVGILLFLLMYARARQALAQRQAWEERRAAAATGATGAATETTSPSQSANASDTVRELYG